MSGLSVALRGIIGGETALASCNILTRDGPSEELQSGFRLIVGYSVPSVVYPCEREFALLTNGTYLLYQR